MERYARKEILSAVFQKNAPFFYSAVAGKRRKMELGAAETLRGKRRLFRNILRASERVEYSRKQTVCPYKQ